LTKVRSKDRPATVVGAYNRRIGEVVVAHQVLRGDVASFVRRLIGGLPEATPLGVSETWELLGQIAAGAVPPTAADMNVVLDAQKDLVDVVLQVLAGITDGVDRESVFLAVDVIDSILEFGRPTMHRAVQEALQSFGGRGEDEMRRAQVTLSDLDEGE